MDSYFNVKGVWLNISLIYGLSVIYSLDFKMFIKHALTVFIDEYSQKCFGIKIIRLKG